MNEKEKKRLNVISLTNSMLWENGATASDHFLGAIVDKAFKISDLIEEELENRYGEDRVRN